MRKSQGTSNRINNNKIIPKHVRFKLQNEKAKTKRKFCKKPARKNSQFSSLQSLIHVRLLAAPWTAAHQASLSISNSCSLLKLMSVESVMPSNQLILCWPLLLPLSILPSIRVFSNESVLCIRWPKYWSFSFNISPSNEYSGQITFRVDWLDFHAV